jgi:hypothetical protein
MVVEQLAEEVFENCSILILLLKSKKVFSRYLIKLSGAGARAAIRFAYCDSVGLITLSTNYRTVIHDNPI